LQRVVGEVIDREDVAVAGPFDVNNQQLADSQGEEASGSPLLGPVESGVLYLDDVR
jgi:hypothetical protein